MRVLITGAAGFIGSHLFRHLAAQSIPVLGLVRGANASPASQRRIAELAALNPTHASLVACSNDSEIAAAIREFRPSACVHLAGRSSVRESLTAPALYADVNVRGTLALLEMLNEVGCRRVVHASTVMVYGPDASRPCRENSLGSGPLSFYGASKLSAEAMLNTFRQLKCLESINLRLFSVYGPDLRDDCVPGLIARACLSGKAFKVFGDGSSQRDYVEINDVLFAFQAALTCAWTPDFPMALNIGSGVGAELKSLMEALEERLERKLVREHHPPVQGEIPAIVADISLARQVLGYAPAVSLSEGLMRLANWYRNTYAEKT